MRGGALPAALLCAALGLALAFAPRRAVAPALIVLLFAACGTAFSPPFVPKEIVFAACWASIVVFALAVHMPRGLPTPLALALALDAGGWAGAVIAQEASHDDLLRALPFVFLCLPGRWAVGRGWQIGVKVVASWLIAIAVLCALLPTTGTPGYVPDHME